MEHDNINNELRQKFFNYAEKMMANSKMHEDTEITPENVYQPAHKDNRDLLYKIVNELLLPGSKILGEENLIKLYELANQGYSCLILSEHVSNLDVPSMFVNFYNSDNPKIKEIFEKIIFIAGVKLNENPLVKLFSEMFSRIVIFPIRSLNKIVGKEGYAEQVNLAKKINVRSARMIKELRSQGNIFLLYPTGTRFRPWNPETGKGIKEAASYLNSFDYFCFASINGNNMPPAEHEEMTKETMVKDVVVFSFGEVRHTKDYIAHITKDQNFACREDNVNMKELIVEKVMEGISALHIKAKEYRTPLIRNI